LSGTGRRALVVDDTAIMRVIVGRVLRDAQFDVIEASNGGDAIQLFYKEKPDIVLMDLNMDGIDGTTAIRGILQINKDAKIVVISATSDAHIVVNVLRLGAKRYVTKPFTPEKLLDAVNAALAM
jgi:two-component system, chemotaxis family, chemotaxis protein CheY